jgi:hypothetical protein
MTEDGFRNLPLQAAAFSLATAATAGETNRFSS